MHGIENCKFQPIVTVVNVKIKFKEEMKFNPKIRESLKALDESNIERERQLMLIFSESRG